jgi:hypothetical protein
VAAPKPEGFRNEALRAALRAAVRGQRAELDALLMRFGGQPGPSPNIKLAQAFGVEFGALPDASNELLLQLADEPAPASSPRVFLPVAAAYGWLQRVRDERNADAAWSAIAELAADSRRPVRFGAQQAMLEFGSREPTADQLLERVVTWLEHDEREISFGASAIALQVLSDARVLKHVRDLDRLFAYLSASIDLLTSATRAASRLEGFRRMHDTLTKVAAAVVMHVRAEGRGASWFAAECERARDPLIREALSAALLELSNVPRASVDRLRQALEASAKPVRDAARVRPGSGRGRRSRPIR